jgi:hypothetical protein
LVEAAFFAEAAFCFAAGVEALDFGCGVAFDAPVFAELLFEAAVGFAAVFADDRLTVVPRLAAETMIVWPG